ncbi:hypothetical protein B0F90DRAFT_1814595 [Multifurca ochricompacta]|uniref:Uncharacterized protein n=1 Tax=Multifurca ochricompacta TaxID=376703 RepID=A0AAD4MCU4_9AGAM|nr:hypothetical protein B0F90DRAFT_1814595 [Multifurca ochricompacta]
MSVLDIYTLVPVLLFTSTAYSAHHFLISHLIKSGGLALLQAQCPPNPGPYNIQYIGFGPIDSLLCLLITFFQSNFDPETFIFNANFMASWSTLIALTFVEAVRSRRSTVLAFPVILGLFYQTQGAGVIFPLFWLALILSGHTRMERVAARIDQANAEATLFAVLIGFAVPSALLLILQDPVVTALWQFFPIWMWAAQIGHLFFRPSSRFYTSGYWTVQATFALTFTLSAISHIAAICTTRENLALLKRLYVPPILPLDPEMADLQLITRAFLQWDSIFTFGSSLVGTLWFATNVKQAALVALWNAIATVAVGPGAAVSGVLIWREWRLNGVSDVTKKKR